MFHNCRNDVCWLYISVHDLLCKERGANKSFTKIAGNGEEEKKRIWGWPNHKADSVSVAETFLLHSRRGSTNYGIDDGHTARPTNAPRSVYSVLDWKPAVLSFPVGPGQPEAKSPQSPRGCAGPASTSFCALYYITPRIYEPYPLFYGGDDAGRTRSVASGTAARRMAQKKQISVCSGLGARFA